MISVRTHLLPLEVLAVEAGEGPAGGHHVAPRATQPPLGRGRGRGLVRGQVRARDRRVRHLEARRSLHTQGETRLKSM